MYLQQIVPKRLIIIPIKIIGALFIILNENY